jgi:hypothetical protein
MGTDGLTGALFARPRSKACFLIDGGLVFCGGVYERAVCSLVAGTVSSYGIERNVSALLACDLFDSVLER